VSIFVDVDSLFAETSDFAPPDAAEPLSWRAAEQDRDLITIVVNRPQPGLDFRVLEEAGTQSLPRNPPVQPEGPDLTHGSGFEKSKKPLDPISGRCELSVAGGTCSGGQFLDFIVPQPLHLQA